MRLNIISKQTILKIKMVLISTKVLVLHYTQLNILAANLASRKIKMGQMNLSLDQKTIDSEKLIRKIWIHIIT
jgi:hypothetical protein